MTSQSTTRVPVDRMGRDNDRLLRPDVPHIPSDRAAAQLMKFRKEQMGRRLEALKASESARTPHIGVSVLTPVGVPPLCPPRVRHLGVRT